MQRFLFALVLASSVLGTLTAQTSAGLNATACPAVEFWPVAQTAATPGTSSGADSSLRGLPAPRIAQANANGLYLFEDHVDLANWREMYRAGITAPYIAGAAIMLNWKSLEPAPNQYCWGGFDSQLADVLRLHKTFTLGLVAGGQTPTWLFDTAGVPALRDLTFNAILSPTGVTCQKLNQPLVWDDKYLHAYAATLVAIANHLKRIPLPHPEQGTAFEALVGVKVSGINVGTEELRLDQHKATPDLKACSEPDVTAIWRNHGYRPQLVVKAWIEIARMTAKIFPGKLLNVDLIPNAPFPSIDEQGNIVPPANSPGKRHVIEPVNEAILQYAIATYGKRLLVQWDALSQDGILPVEVTDSGKQGALTGYQMNGFGGGNFGGSGCIYNPGFKIGPCQNLSDFTQALLDGIHAGARYIEVQPPDVAIQFLKPANPNIKSFTPAFEKARQALAQ